MIHNLDWVDRIDEPGGRSMKPPGRAAAHYLSTTPVSEVAFEELFAPDSPYVLYSIELPDRADEAFLVFLELPPDARRAVWLDEAFIDRGIRKLVPQDTRVAVASVETAGEFVEDALDAFSSGEWGLSFVWNTGRCGSTLLHKAVTALVSR
jgi:hypothetical protein